MPGIGLIASRVLVTTAWLLAAKQGFAASAITIDGRLNEPEWAQAAVYNDFRVTEPLSRQTAPYRTEFRVLTRPEGLLFGIRCEHPRDQRTHGRSARDTENFDADPVIAFVDFEGRGRTAYEFAVSLSGSVRDSVVLNQTDDSRDWDAIWYAAVSEDDMGWSAEIQIPWSVAPEGVVNGDKRTIGLYVARYIKNTSTLYAFPAVEMFSSTFVQDFKRIEVPRFRTSSLDVVPYVSVGANLLDSFTKARAGLDVVWKPNGGNQLTAALKPDFGQVESDDLVVNFSAIKTFFSDKRPFFTEGQQLFDLRMPLNGRLINTRRIGGAPDVGPEGATNLLAGAKYTGDNGSSEYGVFSAVEEDSSAAEGRQYLAARWHRKLGSMSLGYLGTYARHPTIDRQALVHAIDFDSTLGQGVILNAQAIVTDVRDPALVTAPSASDGRGFGTWATLSYQPGGKWQEQLHLTWLDRGFDINDFGYMERADIRQLNSVTRFYRRSYPDSSVLAASNWRLDANLRYNDRDQRLPAFTELGHFWKFRNGNETYASFRIFTSGRDDLLLRGNGNIHQQARHELYAEFQKAVAGRSRFFGWVDVYQEGIDGWARAIHIEPRYFLTESLSVGLKLTYDDSDDWLIWTQGTQAASFRRRQVTTALDGAWYPRPKQELRLKAQWVGLRAEFRQAYTVGADAEPIATPALLSDFSLSNVSVQLRYRYEIGPLADLYVVYSRGGDIFADSSAAGFARQLGDAWHHRTADEFLVKLRYRF